MAGPDIGDDARSLARPHVFPRHLPPSSNLALRRRAVQIGTVATKHFAPLAVRRARKKELPDDAFARPLRLTFEELGATFMKFGQLVGSAPGVFGESVADEFRSCLDTGAPVPFDQVRLVIENELGRSLEEAFATFEQEPIGRASIAVVHRATLHDGTVVAVKVLRPDVEKRVAVDLDLMEPMLAIVARQTGAQAAGDLLSMFSGFREQIGEELDLRNEARAMAHYRVLLDLVHLPLVTVPEPFFSHSSRGVLTMEFLDGVPVDDLAAIERFGYDPKPVVQEVVKGFLLTAIRWGTFHGDVHAGNLLMLRDGRIGVIDWGIVGRLDGDAHLFFRRLVEAALGDDSAWEDIGAFVVKTYGPVIKEGLGLDDDGVTLFVRQMMEPILRRPFGEISLADLMNAPMQKVAEVQGYELHDRSLRTVLRRIREQRKLRAMMESHGGMNSEFDRGQFLLSKQLLYFERYGKMFMNDVSLFHDREFFTQVLADADAEV